MENQLIEQLIAAYTSQNEQKRGLNEKKPALAWLPSLFVSLVLTGLKTAAQNIKDESGKAAALFALDLVGAIAQLLTDADKDNAAQIANFFKENWQRIARGGAEVAGKLIESKAKDGRMKELLLQGIEQVLANDF